MPESERVNVTSLGSVRDISVPDWPNGLFLADTIGDLVGPDSLDELFPRDPTCTLTVDPSTYWQACARWALLYKFGETIHHPGYIITAGHKKRHVLQVKKQDCSLITDQWLSILDSQPPKCSAELVEFLSTSTSNGEVLEWATMQCKPGCQFRLHAHPNLELVYCVSGALFEIRHNGDGSWCFDTLNAGQWLVNETDSKHKSFTATNGDGCVLLVLWSGSHENLDELDHVQDAVNDADNRLNSCQDCLDWDVVKETFLPSSEKATRSGP